MTQSNQLVIAVFPREVPAQERSIRILGHVPSGIQIPD